MRLYFFTIILLYGHLSWGQTQYVHGHNYISLKKDSTMELYFENIDLKVFAKYELNNSKFISVSYKLYDITIDTLNSKKCEGFYINAKNIFIQYGNQFAIPLTEEPDYIPYNFEDSNIQISFQGMDTLLPKYEINNIEKGCYTISINFLPAYFFDFLSFEKINIKRRGRVLVANEIKYKIKK